MFLAKKFLHNLSECCRNVLFRSIKTSYLRKPLAVLGIFIFALATHAQNAVEPRPIESIRTDQKANLSALDLLLQKPCLSAGGPFVAHGRIQNASRKRLTGVDVVLIANGVEVSRKKLDFKSFETRELRFEWPAAPDQHALLLTMIIDPESTIIDRDRADNIVELPVLVEREEPPAYAAMVDAFHIVNSNAQPVGIQLRLRNTGSEPAQFPVSVAMDGRPLHMDLTEAVEPGATVEVTIPWPAGEPFDRAITATTHPCAGTESKIITPNAAVTLEANGPLNGVRGVFQGVTGADTGVIAAVVPPPGPVGVWQSIGPTLIDLGLGSVGRLGSVAIDPSDPDVIYVAARAAGVWKTTDGGANWAVIADALPTIEIEDVDLVPEAPATVFVTTKNDGVYRSDNGGATWIAVTTVDLDATGSDGQGLFIHPADPDQMFLTTRDGLRYSNDAGSSWITIFSISQSERISAFAFDTDTFRRAWVAVNGTAPGRSGVYVSALDGTTPMNWRRLNGCPGARLPAISEDINIKLAFSRGRLFASHKEPDSWTLYRTTNIGCQVGGVAESGWEAAWAPQQSIGNNPVHRRLWSAIYADPTDPKFVYASGTDLWRSSDFGDTFKRITEPHVDHHGFAFHPDNSKIIFTGSDGGLYRSEDRGKDGTWSFIGEGLRITEFYAIADSVREPNVVYGGTQDNGASIYDGSDTIWHFLVGGDSEAVEIGDLDPTLLFELGTEMHQLKRSVGGSNFSNISEDIPQGCTVSAEFGGHSNHFMVHPRDSDILLGTCGGLWRGLPWTQEFSPPNGSNLTRLAIDPQSDTYFAGSTQGDVFAGFGGLDFQPVYRHPQSRQVVDLERDLFRSGVMYAAFSGNNVGRVKRLSPDSSGSAVLKELDLTQGLPTGGINSMAVDLLQDNTIYVATRRSGIFRGQSDDNWATWNWAPYVNGMHPATSVMELQVHPTTGVLRAATFGRGAYEVQTDAPLGSILAAQGRPTFLRVHDVGTGFGPPIDFLDAEVIVKLDSFPQNAFGLQLRSGPDEGVTRRSLDILRDAFRQNTPVRIEYERVGRWSGRILRVNRI